MASIWISVITTLSFLYLLRKILKKKKNLPPGPKGLPIIGHFHLIGKNPHQDLHQLSQKYGPIMYTQFGTIPTFVVSSPKAAKLFLKTHDLIFVNRPYHEAGHYVGYEQRDIVFGKYTRYWRDMRKLVTLELLSNRKINEFQPMRASELQVLVNSFKHASERRETVDLTMTILAHSRDITCLMAFGRKYEDNDLDEKGFKAVVGATMHEASAFSLADYFPYLRWLDIQGSARRLQGLSKIFDGLLERIIDEHVQAKHDEKKTSDFVDTLMAAMESGEAGFEFDRRHVKAVLLDTLIAGMDTSAATVDWILSELIRHPTVMKKLQKELEEVVGRGQMVNEAHLPKLEYLDCVIKESSRLHPIGPLLIHESMEECVVDGFDIPNKARILVNVFSIGRDSSAWEYPETFSPERFIGSDIDLRGKDFQLIPFGAGRRGCPGLQLGLTIVQLIVAQLVHCFDWELSNGLLVKDLDMSERFGLITSRATHLMAIPTYRLHK